MAYEHEKWSDEGLPESQKGAAARQGHPEQPNASHIPFTQFPGGEGKIGKAQMDRKGRNRA